MVSVIFAVLEVSFWALTTVVKLPWKFLTLIVRCGLLRKTLEIVWAWYSQAICPVWLQSAIWKHSKGKHLMNADVSTEKKKISKRYSALSNGFRFTTVFMIWWKGRFYVVHNWNDGVLWLARKGKMTDICSRYFNSLTLISELCKLRTTAPELRAYLTPSMQRFTAERLIF